MSQPTDKPHSDSSSSESSHSENPVFQRLEELDRRISSTVEGLFRDLNQEIRTRIGDVSRWVEEKGSEIPVSWLDDLKELVDTAQKPAPADSAGDRTAEVLRAVARIDAQSDQPAVLRTLVEESADFAAQSALFLVRAGQVKGWASRGLDATTVEAVRVSTDDVPFDDLASAASAVVLDESQVAAIGQLVGAEPAEALLIPLSIRGDMAAALYAGRGADDGPLAAAALQLLTHCAAMTLETLQVSLGASPTLRLRGELAESVVPPAAPEEPTVEEPTAEPTLEEPTADAEDLDEPEIEETVEEPPTEDDEVPVVPSVTYGGTEHVELETTAVPTAEPGIEIHDAEPESDAAQPFELGDEIEVTPVEPVEADSDAASEAGFGPPDAPPTFEMETDTATEAGFGPTDAPSLEPFEAEGDSVSEAGFGPTDAPPLEPFEAEGAPAFEPPDDDFGRESDLPSEEEIAREAAEPEPELEDTNIWELEEDEEDDDEPTAVGEAVAASPESPVAPEPPAFDAAAVGQETVRLDMSALQDHAAAMADTGEVEVEEEEDPGDATAPSLHLSSPPEPVAPEAPAAPVVPDAPVAPQAPAAPVAPEIAASVDLPSPPQAPAVPDVPAAPVAPASPEPAPPAFFEPPASVPAPAPQSFAPEADTEAEPAEPAEPSPPPPASTEVTPPPEPKPEAAGGSTEVVPPTDLEGPGLAFAQSDQPVASDDGSEALHEEARRLARLLVSEIKLYNEEIIDEGRRSGNIYERLKDDIDRSRQMYEERIDPRLADQEDYFYQELVQRLAGGDEALLGM